jgi:hypothetical protein
LDERKVGGEEGEGSAVATRHVQLTQTSMSKEMNKKEGEVTLKKINVETVLSQGKEGGRAGWW